MTQPAKHDASVMGGVNNYEKVRQTPGPPPQFDASVM